MRVLRDHQRATRMIKDAPWFPFNVRRDKRSRIKRVDGERLRETS